MSTKRNRRRLPRCNARIKPTSKYSTKSGLVRYPEVTGDIGSQRCLRSINCPHHKVRNNEVPMLPGINDSVAPLTWEEVKALVNKGYAEVTGHNYYEEA